ncbi:YfgM family protein [Azoarcus taiwanensis]|uniref:Ancillary SecYEG translocon subunit n=1 Tax=Azoarcus taiwanensis TaxID=666964 RepID=A0A972FG48_9RHOO|nr:tetratricopeptide repeat protein [Azoarcus taiwanensis]NMG01726.1 tetratricopeptide repeat protein [Azoarcus taiwanensis]
MAVYDLEEQEQLSKIKAWWEEYGNFVTGIAVAAAIASVSWQGYSWYQNKQAHEAGSLYFLVQQAVEQGDTARAREATGQIIERHGKSPYAAMAALKSAGLQFEAGDYQNSRAHLEWLKRQADNPVLVEIATLRLATVRLAEGDADGALAELSSVTPGALKARFEDLRGDILSLKGDKEQAIVAYRSALEAFAASPAEGADALREVTRIKLESLEN